MKKLIPFLSFLCVTSFFQTNLEAGGSSQASHQAIEQWGAQYVLDLSEEVNQQMNERKANVAIIARSGRARADMPDGIEFTHVGIAVFEEVEREDGQRGYTYTVYNLYQGLNGDKDVSYLAQDFTFDMCAGAVEPEIGVIIPSEKLQTRILEVIRSPAYVAFHNPKYNLLANPNNRQYDNCVTHTLKVLFAAIYQTDDEERIYANIRKYFTPQEINLSMVERIGIKLMSGVSSDDVEDGHIQTATFGSLKRFLEEYGLMEDYFVVRKEPAKEKKTDKE